MTKRSKPEISALIALFEQGAVPRMPGTSPDAARVEREFEDVLLSLSHLAPDAAPPDDLFGRIEAQMETPALPNITTLSAEDGEWQDRGNGVWKKVLAERPDGAVVYLLRCAPGARIRAHHHDSWEQAVVLEGALRMGDFTMRAGDSQFSAANSDHPEIITETGCLLLVVA